MSTPEDPIARFLASPAYGVVGASSRRHKYGNKVLRVYQPNTSSGATATHPVDKRPYQISFAGTAMPRATIISAVFKYDGGPTTYIAGFGPDGSPAYIDTGALGQLASLLFGNKDIDPLKEEGKITIRYGNLERVVRVAPVTGRVTF